MRRKSCVCGSRIAGRHTPLAPRSIRNTQSRQKNDSSSWLPVDTQACLERGQAGGLRSEQGDSRAEGNAQNVCAKPRRGRQGVRPLSYGSWLRWVRRFRAARPHHGHCPQPAGRHPSAPAQSPRPGPLAAQGPVAPAAPSWAPGSFVRDDEPHANHETLAAHQQPEEKTRVTKRRPKWRSHTRGPSVACRCTDVLYFPVVSSIDFPPYSLYLVFEIPRTVWAVLRQLRLATRCFLYIHAPTNMSKLYSSN